MGSAGTIEGVVELKAKLSRYLRDLETIPQEEVQRAASMLNAEIKQQTPYKTGKLERSVRVTTNFSGRARYVINVRASARSSGGFDYSWLQHEKTNWTHPIKGKAHYISDPFKKITAQLKRRLRERMKPP